MPPRVDFLITNDRHHAAMFRPVALRLIEERGYRCRVLSLCELRGLESPASAFAETGIELVRVLSPRLGRTRSAMKLGAARGRRLLRLVRPVAWFLVLRRRLGPLLDPPPDLVVVPNDAAYPYDRITALLRQLGIPFLLVQEGVRYAEVKTRDPGVLGQGRGGAAAIAAWGETSAEYFRRQGAPPDRIIATGNPRFDVIPATDWSRPAEELRHLHGLGRRVLLFLSNPIETHGLATHDEKLEMVRRFVAGIGPLFRDPDFHLVIKLHAGEVPAEFGAAIAGLPDANRSTILGEAPLYPLLALASGAVVLTSSAGLEGLLFGTPLAVLEIPGVGFVHDYVSGGAACGITWAEPLAGQIRDLLEPGADRRARVEAYLARTLADRLDATGRVAHLVNDLVEQVAAGATAGGDC